MTYGYTGYPFHTSPYDAAAAASMLDGPGSTASLSGPYSGAYAHEAGNGAIYTYQYSYNELDFTSASSYLYRGPSDTTKFNDSYTNYLSRTAASPYADPKLYGRYYATYPSSYGYTTTDDRVSSEHYHYAGQAEYFDSISRETTQTTAGYTFYSYIHGTFERIDGQFVQGSGHQYYSRTTTDPYGNTSARVTQI